MADVVRFEEKLSRLPRRPMAEPCEAKILLFTGVRYERYSEDDRPSPERRSSGSKGKKH